MATSNPQTLREPLPSVITVAHLVYALHTVAIVVGIVGAATVVGSFVGGLPSIAAVIFNYVKRGDARGTWVYTHYQWQIRTFWWAVLWALIGWALVLTIIGGAVGVPILIALTLWLIYRRWCISLVGRLHYTAQISMGSRDSSTKLVHYPVHERNHERGDSRSNTSA